MGIRSLAPQVLAVMVKNLLMVSLGMNMGFPEIFITDVKPPTDFGNVSSSQVLLSGSIILPTTLIGSVLTGVLTQPIGRKRSMQIAAIPFIACWVVIYFSNQIWHLDVAFATIGFIGGAIKAPFQAYVAEITEPCIRGVLATTAPLSLLIGSFIQMMLGSFYHWRSCALISCTFPVVAFILLCFVPESPYWLLQNGKPDEAALSLAWLRGWRKVEHVREENVEMTRRSECTATKSNPSCCSCGSVKPFLEKSFIWPFSLVTFMFFLSSFTGAASLHVHAASVFSTMKVPLDSQYLTLSLGLSQIAGSFASVILIHISGKRRIVFASLAGICVSNVAIAIYAHITGVRYISTQTQNFSEQDSSADECSSIPLIFLIFLSLSDHLGNYTVPWVMIGEVFSYETRLVACGISNSISYLFGFISHNIFAGMVSSLTIPGTYYLYGGISLIGVFILYFTLPETEGRSLKDISDHFRGVSKLGNKMQKRDGDDRTQDDQGDLIDTFVGFM